MINRLYLRLIGVLFIILGFLAIINSLVIGDYPAVLWFCYSGLIVLGFGFFTNNHLLVRAESNILLIPSVIWSTDFFYVLFTNNSLLGITNYFFLDGFSAISRIISLQHVLLVPLTIIGLFLLKHDNNPSVLSPLVISVSQVILLFFLSIIFSTSSRNINWVYHTSIALSLSPFIYSLSWLVGFSIIIFFTDRIIHNSFS